MVNNIENFSPTEVFVEKDGDVTTPDFVNSDSEHELISKDLGIPLENIILDEKGNIVRIVDDKGDIFDSDDEAIGAEAKENEIPVNDLDAILKGAGIIVEEIEFEDGTIKNIKDLTKEEQIVELTSFIKELQESKSNEEIDIKSILKDEEISLITYLRESGKTIEEVAEEIVANNPAIQVKNMSDEDVVRYALKQERPTYSEEDIDDEIKDLAERNKLGKEAKFYRNKFADIKGQTNVLGELNQKQQENLYNSTVEEVNQIIEVAKQTNQMLGFDLDDAAKSRVLDLLIPKGLDKGEINTPELVKLTNTPQGMFELAFYKSEVPRMIQALIQWGNEQREVGKNEVLGKLPKK